MYWSYATIVWCDLAQRKAATHFKDCVHWVTLDSRVYNQPKLLFFKYLIKPFKTVLMSTVISNGLAACLQWQKVSILFLGKLSTLLINRRQCFLLGKYNTTFAWEELFLLQSIIVTKHFIRPLVLHTKSYFKRGVTEAPSTSIRIFLKTDIFFSV